MPYQKSDTECFEELLGSKLIWRLLRVLVMRPTLSFRLTDLVSRLETSNKSVLRVLRKLSAKGLVLGTVGKHERYRINPDIRMTRKIWSIFMSERIMQIDQKRIEIIFPFFERIKNKTEAFIICECPLPKGTSPFEGSASTVIVSDAANLDDIEPIPTGLHVTLFTKQQFCRLDSYISQSALLDGIVLRGEGFVFSLLNSLKSFPQTYIIEKLNACSNALLYNNSLNKELQNQQYEIMDKCIHDFETQFSITAERNNRESFLDRINDIRDVVAKNNNGKYL